MSSINTIIELFDECQIENVMSALVYEPQKIIFVGYESVMTEKRQADIKIFLRIKRILSNLEFITVPENDFGAISSKIEKLISENDDCVFDTTGGEDLILTVMGKLAAEKEIPKLYFSIPTREIVTENFTEEPKRNSWPNLTCEEYITLYGGKIAKNPLDDFVWEMNPEFKQDILTIWDICNDNNTLWNKQCTIFGQYRQYGSMSDNFKMTVDIEHMRDSRLDPKTHTEIMAKLRKYGIIKDFRISPDKLIFRYKNEQVYRLLLKAGNILELYLYMILCELSDKNPELGISSDTGVQIDWDGVIHSRYSEKKDTKNEIDCLAVFGVVPVFISCKNGDVKKEALYELETVANRFGGKYAKKIIMVGALNDFDDSTKFLLERAKDMDISVIETERIKSHTELSDIILKEIVS